MIGLEYKDTITIVDQSYDGYGDETVKSQAEIPALFLQSTGETHIGNHLQTNSDAHAYIDPEHPFVKDNALRLEGMIVKANPFGGPEAEAWYKIVNVRIGMDKLLTNSVDNVHVYMQKTDTGGITNG